MRNYSAQPSTIGLKLKSVAESMITRLISKCLRTKWLSQTSSVIMRCTWLSDRKSPQQLTWSSELASVISIIATSWARHRKKRPTMEFYCSKPKSYLHNSTRQVKGRVSQITSSLPRQNAAKSCLTSSSASNLTTIGSIRIHLTQRNAS